MPRILWSRLVAVQLHWIDLWTCPPCNGWFERSDTRALLEGIEHIPVDWNDDCQFDNGIHRTDSKYPMVDWVTDVAVIAGVYLFLAVMEVCLGLWKQRRKVAAGDEDVPAVRSEK